MNLPLLYKKSPLFIQNCLISLRGFVIQKTRFNKKFREMLSHFENSNPHLLDEDRFRQFINQANHSPFWKNRFQQYEVKIDADDILSELSKLPILTKNEVKENVSRILNPNINRNKIKTVKTGGTTGAGMIFYQTKLMENAQWAIWWRHWHRYGITRKEWCAWFGGMTIIDVKDKRTPYWRINYPGRQVMFSPQHLNEQTVHDYYSKLRSSGIKWIHGYPSQIALLASLILEKGLAPLKMNFITTGAENLLEHQKKIIEEAFLVRPVMHYGLSEGVANICELPSYNLQVDKDFAFCEFIPFENKSLYRIIGTNYYNDAFPLIRYDTGDIASVVREKDKTIIERIEGRSQDFIDLGNGIMLGPLNHVFKDLTSIREAQIFQPVENTIIVRVVKGKDYNKQRDESLLLKNIQERITGDMNIKIKYVSELKRTSSGKLRLFISEVENGP